MVKYPKEAYNPAMEVYRHIPQGLKGTANSILGKYKGSYTEGDAPPYQMARELLSLVPKEKQGELEAIVERAKEFEKQISSATPQYMATGALLALLVLYLV